jgi:glycosyltransferase involved in cell wall biosynthesis
MIKLSIIIAVYNEEKTIKEILKKIHSSKKNENEYEILIVDDGSTDKTSSILKECRNLYSELITNKKNMGKGYSVREGMRMASGDYIIFQDADLEYDPIEFNNFINIINKFNPDLVLGSRFKFKDYCRSHSFYNFIGNKIITTMFNILNNTTFSDVYTCYVCFKNQLLDVNNLKTNGFEQQAELLGIIIKKSKKNYEIPINYNGRSFEEGKKIKWYDFFSVLYQIIKIKFIN